MTKKTSSRVRGSTRTARMSTDGAPRSVEEVQEHLRRLRLSLELLQPRLQGCVDYLVRSQEELERRFPKKDLLQPAPLQPS
jgi:hypothetical protein